MKILLLIALVALSVGAQAQQVPEHGGRSSEELWLSLGVLGFGALLILLEVAVMFRVSKGWGTASIRM